MAWVLLQILQKLRRWNNNFKNRPTSVKLWMYSDIFLTHSVVSRCSARDDDDGLKRTVQVVPVHACLCGWQFEHNAGNFYFLTFRTRIFMLNLSEIMLVLSKMCSLQLRSAVNILKICKWGWHHKLDRWRCGNVAIWWLPVCHAKIAGCG